MSKNNRHMEMGRGYSRAQHKAVTQAVLDDHFREEVGDEMDQTGNGAISSLFSVSDEERARAAPSHNGEAVILSAAPPSQRGEGFFARVLDALRGLVGG